jgi:cysteine-rich repeat protein
VKLETTMGSSSCTADETESAYWQFDHSGVAPNPISRVDYAYVRRYANPDPVIIATGIEIGASSCLAQGQGPCTPSNEGSVCQTVNCSVAGLCMPNRADACYVDADCSSGQFCERSSWTCRTRLPNGTSLPQDGLHDACDAQSPANAACASGQCNPSTTTCGAALGGVCASASECASNLCNGGLCSESVELLVTSGAIAYAGSATVIDSTLSITGTLPTLDGAVVSINGGFVSSQDRLEFTNQNGISGAYDAQRGTLRLTGSATLAQYQAALRSVTYRNTSSSPTGTSRVIAFSLGSAVANTDTGHFYEYVASTQTWTNANAIAQTRRYLGLRGYLVTITSGAENDFIRGKLTADGWIGATTPVNAFPRTWSWSAGPDTGTAFCQNTSAGVCTAISGRYANWASGEPNNFGTGEGCGQIYFVNSGRWNDLPCTGHNLPGYIVEYGDSPGDPVLAITGARTLNLAVCGNGAREGAEGCDDGNLVPGDGCSRGCGLEPGFACGVSGGPCSAQCGDGVQTAGEACDDGNTADGDGCSAACGFEAGWLCANDAPSLVTNGGFDDGNVGFTSNLTYVASGINSAGNQYAISTGNAFRPDFCAGVPDGERSAANRALYFNAGNDPSQILYQTTVNVTANTAYVVEARAMSWSSDAPPRLVFTMDGVDLTPEFQATVCAPSTPWTRVSATFRATSTGPVTLRVFNRETAFSGNDGALDGFSVRQAAPMQCGRPSLDPPGLIVPANQALYPVAGGCFASAGLVTVSVGGAARTVACVGGRFTATLDVSGEPDGLRPVVVSQGNGGGVATATGQAPKDATAPAAPTIDSPSAAFVNAARPELSGACESGASVEVSSDQGAVCSTACVDKAWRCTPGADFAEGLVRLSATQTDPAGNASPNAPLAFEVDLSSPNAPKVDRPADGDFVATRQPHVSGTCEPGATVFVQSRAGASCSASCVAGRFGCALAPDLEEGEHELRFEQIDRAGNVSGPSAVVRLTVDVTPPSAPAITAPSAGSLLATATPRLSGTCEPFARVRVEHGPALACLATCDARGAFSCTSASLPDGDVTLSLRQLDLAGNESPAAPHTLRIDTTPPSRGAIIAPAAGSVLTSVRPVITGVGEPGATAIVTSNGVELCRTLIAPDGTWSCVANARPGPQALQVVVEDEAGNRAPISPAHRFTIDVVPPRAPSLLLPSAAQVVSPWPVFRGLGEPGSEVTVSVGGQAHCRALVDELGQWACLGTQPLPAGAHQASALASDPAGNASLPSAQVGFEVRAGAAPSAPIITAPANGAPVSDPTPWVRGLAEPGSIVVITRGTLVLCQTSADAAGAFACEGSIALPDGLHDVQARATNAAGDSSNVVSSFVVDTAPLAPPVIVSPSSGAVVRPVPVFAGTARALSNVSVLVDGVAACSAEADGGGRFACLPSAALSAGPHTVSAIASTGEGVSSAPSSGVPFTVDASALPAAPAVLVPADGGLLSGADVVFSGLAEPSSRVEVFVNGQRVCEAVASPSGDFACTGMGLPAGSHSVTARASASTGTSADSGRVAFEIDPIGPVAPRITSPAMASVTSAWPVFEGESLVSQLVLVRVDGRDVCSARADAQGRFQCSAPVPLEVGDRQVVAVLIDRAGREVPSAALTFRVSTQVPRLERPSAGANLGDARPDFAGVGETGHTIEIYVDGGEVCRTSVASTGRFECRSSPLSDGLKTAFAIADDGFGSRVASRQVMFTIDTRAPMSPQIRTPARGERILGERARFSGIAEAGSLVSLLVEGRPGCQALTSSVGTWACEVGGLSHGPKVAQATARDAAGNESERVSQAFEVVVALPTPTLTSPQADAREASAEVTFAGRGEPGTEAVVYDRFGEPLCRGPVSGQGDWRCVATLSPGPHLAMAGVEWGAGKSALTEPVPFMVLSRASFSGSGIGAGCTAGGASLAAWLGLAVLLRRRRR